MTCCLSMGCKLKCQVIIASVDFNYSLDIELLSHREASHYILHVDMMSSLFRETIWRLFFAVGID